MTKYALAIALIAAMAVAIYLSSCTISLQNISTHGTANDLVDENMATSPNVSPVITAPMSPI